MAQVVLGAAAEQFNDPTATLLLQVDCIERDSQELRCVGYAVIPLFMDPRENAQPRRKNLLDYVLNQVCPSANSCSLFSLPCRQPSSTASTSSRAVSAHSG